MSATVIVASLYTVSGRLSIAYRAATFAVSKSFRRGTGSIFWCRTDATPEPAEISNAPSPLPVAAHPNRRRVSWACPIETVDGTGGQLPIRGWSRPILLISY